MATTIIIASMSTCLSCAATPLDLYSSSCTGVGSLLATSEV